MCQVGLIRVKVNPNLIVGKEGMTKSLLPPNFMPLTHQILCTILCRIAYSVYLCEQLQRLFPKQKVQLMYDIACNLEKHLKVMTILMVSNSYYCLSFCVLWTNGRLDILENFEFAVPIFHAYGHESACQVW